MEHGPDARQVSVAPPGWTPPVATVPVSTPVAVSAATPEGADAAVKWRIYAAIVDNLLLYLSYFALCLLLHWSVADPTHVLVFALSGLAYHFVMELRDGQTIGKRRYGIRVMSVDGGPADAKAVLLRTALRLFDQLPLLYVSGLVSMVRTGPARRQRMGDVAGRTVVVAVDGRAKLWGTPGWLLPVATLIGVLLSALAALAIADAGNRPLSSDQRTEMVESCEAEGLGQVVDCGCVVTELQAAGYDTPNSLQDLGARTRQAVLTHNPAAVPAVLRQAARLCHH